MRTKRSARGRFHRSYPRPDSAIATARPLPPPVTDDISESSDDSADSLEVQNSSESDDSVSETSDDEMRDDFDEKTCLECNRGEGLMFCSGIGCPIALHEKCIFGQPMYDGGKFYCPYCWYKLQQSRREEWRAKVMLSKKNVSTFINCRPRCGDKEKRKNKRAKKNDMNAGKTVSEANQSEHVNIMVVDKNGVVSRLQGIVDNEVSTEQGKNDQHHDDDEKDNAEDNAEQLRHVEKINIKKADLPKKSTMHPCTKSTKATREPEEVAPSKKPRQSEMTSKKIIDPPSVNEKHKRMLWKPEDDDMLRNKAHELEGDCQHYTKVKNPCNDRNGETSLAHGIVDGMEYAKNDQQKETNTNEEHVETFTAKRVSKKGDIDGGFHKSPGAKSKIANKSKYDQISMEKVEQMNNKASTSSVPFTETRKSVDEFSTLKMPKKSEIPTKNKDLPFGNGKRKRILWKPEEEEMIREGVHKFSTDINKNIPWKKILEYGQHIFDPTRNPSDLKDKWKKLGKQS